MPETRSLFENIANVYDPLNNFFSLGRHKGWKTRLIRNFLLCNNLLDIATGTSDVSIEFINQNKSAFAVGLDPSYNMLLKSEKKIRKLQFQNNIKLINGLAENLPFHNNTFDAVSISFGIRNTMDPLVSLKEMYRVLKKGGKVGILEFALPVHRILGPIYMKYLNHFFPLIGSLLGVRKEYEYLGDSISKFPNRNKFIELMDKAGFVKSLYFELNVGTVILYLGRK